MAIFNFLPLPSFLLAAYLLITLLNLGFGLETQLFSLDLLSKTTWTLKVSDLLVIFGILLLYIEIFKATRTSVASIVDHMLSLIVFVAFIILFLVLPQAGTSTFLILTVIAMIDVVAGFTITISSARRDIDMH